MDSRFIILGKCLCGQQLALDQMIDSSTAKCINCNNEFNVHIDIEPNYTLDEWEKMEASCEEIVVNELIELPF